MRLSIRIILTATIAVLGVLSVGNPTVFASTLGQTTDNSTNDLVSATGQHIWVFTPDADQTFNTITVWNDGTYTATQTLQLINSSGTVIATGTSTNAIAGQTAFVFNSTNLTSGTKYALRPMSMYLMGAPYNGANDYDTKGCKEYSYTIGNPLGTCGTGNTQTKADIWVSFSQTYTTAISLTDPANGKNQTHWDIDVEWGSDCVLGCFYGVQYGTSTQSYPWDDEPTLTVAQSVHLPGDTDSYLFQKSLELPYGTYYARAYIRQYATTTPFIYSSVQSFTISATGEIFNGASSTEWIPSARSGFSTTSPLLLLPLDSGSFWYVDCTDATGWDVFSLSGMTCWAKKWTYEVGYGLFVPHYTDELFTDALDYFKGGFPFSISYAVISSIQAVVDSQMTYEELALPIDLGGATSTLVLFSDDYPIALMGQDTWDTLYTLMGGLLWVSAVFGAYYTAKKLL